MLVSSPLSAPVAVVVKAKKVEHLSKAVGNTQAVTPLYVAIANEVGRDERKEPLVVTIIEQVNQRADLVSPHLDGGRFRSHVVDEEQLRTL